MIRPKIKIKHKKVSLLENNYTLTTKQIICNFKYLVMCFDPHTSSSESTPDSLDGSGSELSGGAGLVVLTPTQLTGLIEDQNIDLVVSLPMGQESDSYDLGSVVVHLKEWHPLISKVEFDLEHPYVIDNLLGYPLTWEQAGDIISSLQGNECLRTPEQFEKFRHLPHLVIDVKVSFQLLRKISKVEDFGVNFQYLHKLLAQSILDWNRLHPLYLDEISLPLSQLPFISPSTIPHEPIQYVYPYLSFIPLLNPITSGSLEVNSPLSTCPT